MLCCRSFCGEIGLLKNCFQRYVECFIIMYLFFTLFFFSVWLQGEFVVYLSHFSYWNVFYVLCHFFSPEVSLALFGALHSRSSSTQSSGSFEALWISFIQDVLLGNSFETWEAMIYSSFQNLSVQYRVSPYFFLASCAVCRIMLNHYQGFYASHFWTSFHS